MSMNVHSLIAVWVSGTVDVIVILASLLVQLGWNYGIDPGKRGK